MIWKFMVDGGWCMAPIVACSVLGLALILERAFFWLCLGLRRDEKLRAELLTLTLRKRAVERSGDPVVHALAALLKHPDDPTVATGAADRALRETRTGLPILTIVAGVSCSLGLFGTVLGVALAFDALAQGKAQDLASALAVALNTTVLGLVVYLPVYVVSSLAQFLTGRLGFEIEQGLNLAGHRLRTHALGRVTVAE